MRRRFVFVRLLRVVLLLGCGTGKEVRLRKYQVAQSREVAYDNSQDVITRKVLGASLHDFQASNEQDDAASKQSMLHDAWTV